MAQQVNEGVVDALVVSVTNKGMVGGAIAGLYGYLVQINWLGLGGFLIALIGLAANIYFQHRRDKREAAESLARIAALRDQCETP
jgi:hypothetical protein